jgi:polyisoprenyl-teichoic acid--peptidoglycan teichoic acid transferase
MREFQSYTKAPESAHRQRWLWFLPFGLVAVLLLVGLQAGAVPTPVQPLGNEANPGSEGSGDGGAHTGWLGGIFGGSQDITDGPLNVLVLGVDERPDSEAEGTGTRSDTIMLVRIVPETGEVKLLSVPRDLLVEIEPGVKNRINAAYSYGGIEQTVEALQGYTGVPVERYVIVDFGGFKHVINAMGGVEVDVEDEIPPKYGIKDGLQTLNGAQALFYARYRGTGGGDLDRIEHQQRLTAALRSKALDWDTVTKLPEILKVVDRNVETNLGFEEAITLGRVLINRGRNAQMTSVQLRGTPDTLPNGDQVLVPDEAANEAVLQEFRY